MHIDQLALAKSSIKRKTHFICLRTCHTANFGQVWPENNTRDWPLDKVVTQRTMAKCGKNKKKQKIKKLLHAFAGLLVDATMIALFACRRLEQNGNGRANVVNNKSWPKSLIISDYSRIQYYESDPPKNWVRSNHYRD